MSSEIHLNDVGTQFLITIVDANESPMDISNAVGKEVIFKKPSGSLVSQPATFYTNGSDGKIYYVSQDGDLDEIGSWKIQCHVETSGVTLNPNWHTNFLSFKVYRNL
jgi:hypothetical protein